MKRMREIFPQAATGLLVGTALIHGPIPQLPDYHDFADQTRVAGIPHFADVISNLGFILVALWAWFRLLPGRHHPDLASGWGGYRLFVLGLFLTGFGSAYYHLAPDNARLVWDRLPIALACGGLLAGVWGDTRRQPSRDIATGLALVAVMSVAWWHFTEATGAGDLRPYLMMQGLPLLLIPLWQWLYDGRHSDRWFFGGALLLYAIAKYTELGDHEIGAVLGVTGHTLKHLFATLSSALIVAGLDRRVRTTKAVVVRPRSEEKVLLLAGDSPVVTTGRR